MMAHDPRPTRNLALLATLLVAVLGSVAPARGGGPLSGGGGGGQGGLPFLGDDGVGGIERTSGTSRPHAQGKLAGGGPIVPLTAAPGHDRGERLIGIDLGQGLPAAGDAPPRLAADGRGLQLGQARAGAAAVVVLGLEALDLPFHGGVLVPRPDLVLRPITVDDDGTLVIPLAWAARLPGGTTLLAQVWTMRDGIPAASNALALQRR